MGNCSSCKKSSSCSKKQEYQVREADIDISSYLKPLKDNSPVDSTPLNYPCQCPNSPKLPRYACLNCIRSWVNAVTQEEVLEAIETYRDKVITADRLQDSLQEKQWREKSL